MPSLIEKVSIVTQAIRTLLAVVLVGGLGAAGWYGYTLVDSRQRASRELAHAKEQLKLTLEHVASLEEVVETQEAEIDRLATAMRLLKVDHRVALLSVRDQTRDPATGQLISWIEFQELDDRGEPMEPAKQFQIPGDVVYIDSWIVKFDDKYVEQADIHRSTSLVLFRRIFGDKQRPTDGFVLDEVGFRPRIYGRGGRVSDLEKQIWGDFWSVANDMQKQNALGIRAAHGEAPSIKVQPGKIYRITLRASGGLTVTVEPAAPANKPQPAA